MLVKPIRYILGKNGGLMKRQEESERVDLRPTDVPVPNYSWSIASQDLQAECSKEAITKHLGLFGRSRCPTTRMQLRYCKSGCCGCWEDELMLENIILAERNDEEDTVIRNASR